MGRPHEQGKGEGVRALQAARDWSGTFSASADMFSLLPLLPIRPPPRKFFFAGLAKSGSVQGGGGEIDWTATSRIPFPRMPPLSPAEAAAFEAHVSAAPGTARPDQQLGVCLSVAESLMAPASWSGGGAGEEAASVELRLRLDALVASFVASFKRAPAFALRVPGRINLIGEVAPIVPRPVNGLIAALHLFVILRRGLRLLELLRRTRVRVDQLARG